MPEAEPGPELTELAVYATKARRPPRPGMSSSHSAGCGHFSALLLICPADRPWSPFIPGVPVTSPCQPEAVLLGAAMLGAVASGLSLQEVRERMGGAGRTVTPRPELER